MSAVAVASHEFRGFLRCGVHWGGEGGGNISFQALTAIHYTHRLAAYFRASLGFEHQLPSVCRPFDRMPAGLQAYSSSCNRT
jgi:maltoporin